MSIVRNLTILWCRRAVITGGMAAYSVAFLVLLGAVSAYSQTTYVPICDPNDYSDSPSLPFPALPQQFSAVVEANIRQFNSTFIAKEFYDALGNRGKLILSHNDTDQTGIWDYDDLEIFWITGQNCDVLPIAEQGRNGQFGFQLVNESVHIGSVQDFFGLHSDQPMNYTGRSELRGIPTHTWESCFVEENNSYVLLYHFVSGGEWSYAHQAESIPLEIMLTGRRLNSTTGEITQHNHIYTFVDFNDVVSDNDFKVPFGLPCKGRITGPEPPGPALPQYFSMYVEVESGQSSTLIKEYYDYDHNLFRFDSYYRGDSTPVQFSFIVNFDIEVGYFINRKYSNCTVFAVGSNFTFFASEVGGDGNLQLKSPRDLFFLSNDSAYAYEGVTTVRGVAVDAWITVLDQIKFGDSNLSNVIIEWFFTRPGWEVNTGISTTTDPTPWQLKLSGILSTVNSSNDEVVTRNLSIEYDIIGFSSVEPAFDVFDTSICVSPEDYRVLSMAVPGQELGVTNLGDIRRNIRAAITNYADINPLQVGNIEVVGENGTHVFVVVHLSSLPEAAMTETTSKSASEIIELILSNVKDNRLPFTVMLSPGVAVYPLLLHVHTTPDNESSDSSCGGLSSGQATGLAIGAFILGILAGTVVLVVVGLLIKLCRRPVVVTTVKYEKHQEDS